MHKADNYDGSMYYLFHLHKTYVFEKGQLPLEK